MDALAAGLTALVNGLIALAGVLVSPVVGSLVLGALACAWLATMEIEELDRQGTKPEVGRH